MTTYFITICAHMQRNLFQRDEVAELMVAALFKYRDAGEFELHEYVVMPNHVHLLLSFDDQQQLGRVIQLIKGGFSRSLHEHGIAFPTVWQQRYHDRRVRDENEFAEFARYIRQNPVRKGLTENAEDFPYSSAHRSQVPRLKPLDLNKCRGDANLKVRSTVQNRGKEDAMQAGVPGLKPRNLNKSGGDANLKVRSTVQNADGGDASLKARSTVQNRDQGDANLKVRSTVQSQELSNV